jgi:hypothetical protein
MPMANAAEARRVRAESRAERAAPATWESGCRQTKWKGHKDTYRAALMKTTTQRHVLGRVRVGFCFSENTPEKPHEKSA